MLGCSLAPRMCCVRTSPAATGANGSGLKVDTIRNMVMAGADIPAAI